MAAMIEVNLLKDQTSRARKAKAASEISRMGLLCASIFLLAAGSMSVWSYCVHRRITAAAEKRDQLRNRDSHIQKLNQEAERLRKRMLLHQSRIDLIEQLKQGQAEPVLLLNAVILGLPQGENIWLISLSQKPDSVRITGFAQQIEAIPEFMNNLAFSGIFDSVDLEEIDSQERASRFSLLCTNAKKTEVARSHGLQ